MLRVSATARRLIAYIGAVALAAALPVAAARACDLATAPSSRWSLAADNGVWWLKTPCGERFYSLGVNILDGGNGERAKIGEAYAGYRWEAFAPTLGDWVTTTQQRLREWGFNSAGAWSLPPQQLQLPAVINLELGRLAKFHWFDPFAPDMPERMAALARELVAPYRDSPYRIGYFSDNEVGWWAGALFVFYSQKPASSYTKQHWVGLLRRHYRDDWARFAADFTPPSGVDSWPALLASTETTRMRPGGNGIAAVREWTGIIAEHYYALTRQAIRAADPEALYFGDRLPIYYDPSAVRAMAPYVDAIAVNYNPDAGDGWIARYFFDGLRALSGGKPVLITEWFFAARENRTGNLNNGHLVTVQTQAERARGAAAAALNFAAIPDVVGTHWFQYYDHPKGGRADGEDYNFGLVDISDRPYEFLTEALAIANRQVPAVHQMARGATAALADFTLPRAEISLADHSLSDWPKPASLVPPLTASPGAVVFNDIYLSWSERGLNLATIGQDYFDLNLFVHQGEFPLGDAYHLEIGVDVGAGPRRVTLFFIPGQGDRYDHQVMTVKLCAGAAAEVHRAGCTAPADIEAVYFGADQPRITAEMLIPWSTLGVAPPAPGQTLRAELAITSWHRERWMSLSGRTPEAALADPTGWRVMHLGDGLAVTAPAPRPGAPG